MFINCLWTAHWPSNPTSLPLCSCFPYGSSDAERSLRKANKTSNNKHRGAKMDSETKEMVNFIYTNAPLQLTNLASKKRAAPPAEPVVVGDVEPPQ
jgi:hypothetical protein